MRYSKPNSKTRVYLFHNGSKLKIVNGICYAVVQTPDGEQQVITITRRFAAKQLLLAKREQRIH